MQDNWRRAESSIRATAWLAGSPQYPRSPRPCGAPPCPSSQCSLHEQPIPQAAPRHAARLLRRARRGGSDRARRLRPAAVHLARARREPGAPRRPGDAQRLPDPADRAPSRPGLPLVPGPRGVPRHPRPDRAGGPGRPARRDRRQGRRSVAGQPGGADAADRRPLAGGGSAVASTRKRSPRTARSRIGATKTASTSSTGPRRRSRTST